MDNNRKYWFFGSKLNTVLLLILIILMIVALRWMYQDKEKYFPIEPKDNKIYKDGMSNKDAKYFDNLTVPNPKLEEILGSDGRPLVNSYRNNGLYFQYSRDAKEKTLNGTFGMYHEIGIQGDNYSPDTLYFFKGEVPKELNMCDPSNNLKSKTITIKNKTFLSCESKAEPYVQYVYTINGKTLIIGTMLSSDKNETYINLGSIEIE